MRLPRRNPEEQAALGLGPVGTRSVKQPHMVNGDVTRFEFQGNRGVEVEGTRRNRAHEPPILAVVKSRAKVGSGQNPQATVFLGGWIHCDPYFEQIRIGVGVVAPIGVPLDMS